jgi:uncharacterized protein (TIGR02996 family)
MDEQALLKAIAENPTDRINLLAYADYLEENGKEFSTEFRYLAENIDNLYMYRNKRFKGFTNGHYIIPINCGMWFLHHDNIYRYHDNKKLYGCIGIETYQKFADSCVENGVWEKGRWNAPVDKKIS